MALPTVGTKGLNIAKLSPKVRKIIAHRTREAARREYAPVVAADQAAIPVANKAYRTQARSVRGATDMVQNAVTQSLGGLKGSGLEGGYLKQVENELLARSHDASASVPFLLADAASERADAITKARLQILQDQAQQQQSAAGMFNQQLKEARGQAASVIGARRKKAEEQKEEGAGGVKFDPRSLHLANLAFNQLFTKWKENAPITVTNPETGEKEQVPFQKANPLHSKADWQDFARGVAEADPEGIDVLDVLEIIRRRFARLARDPNGASLGR